MEEVIESYGSEGLPRHLEASADLHRAVVLLWEGVGTIFQSSQGTRKNDEPPSGRAQQDVLKASPSSASSHSPAMVSSVEERLSRMLRDHEALDVPMHLEDLPMNVTSKALSIDVGRVKASTEYFMAVMQTEAVAATTVHRVVALPREGETAPPSAPVADTDIGSALTPFPAQQTCAPEAPAVPSPQVVNEGNDVLEADCKSWRDSGSPSASTASLRASQEISPPASSRKGSSLVESVNTPSSQDKGSDRNPPPIQDVVGEY